MIVITTPTGQIGRQVLGNLLDSGEQLRGIVRDPSQLPAEVREDLGIVEGTSIGARNGSARVLLELSITQCDEVCTSRWLSGRSRTVSASLER